MSKIKTTGKAVLLERLYEHCHSKLSTNVVKPISPFEYVNVKKVIAKNISKVVEEKKKNVFDTNTLNNNKKNSNPFAEVMNNSSKNFPNQGMGMPNPSPNPRIGNLVSQPPSGNISKPPQMTTSSRSDPPKNIPSQETTSTFSSTTSTTVTNPPSLNQGSFVNKSKVVNPPTIVNKMRPTNVNKVEETNSYEANNLNNLNNQPQFNNPQQFNPPKFIPPVTSNVPKLQVTIIKLLPFRLQILI